MLAEPQGTSFDLHFRLFGTPVRVHPFFWVVSAILGWHGPNGAVLWGNGLGDTALWVFCVFFSILLHEFGHVWAGRFFGASGYIVLYGMGGLAVGSNALSAWWKRVLVSFAGPAIQLLFFALLTGLMVSGVLRTQGNRALGELIGNLWVINLFWAILNLLPVWPLDGGMISREVFAAVLPGRGVLVSLYISLLVAGGLALDALMAYQSGRHFIPYFHGGAFTGILFALFAIDNLKAIQYESARQRRSYSDDDLPWER